VSPATAAVAGQLALVLLEKLALVLAEQLVAQAAVAEEQLAAQEKSFHP